MKILRLHGTQLPENEALGSIDLVKQACNSTVSLEVLTMTIRSIPFFGNFNPKMELMKKGCQLRELDIFSC